MNVFCNFFMLIALLEFYTHNCVQFSLQSKAASVILKLYVRFSSHSVNGLLHLFADPDKRQSSV